LPVLLHLHLPSLCLLSHVPSMSLLRPPALRLLALRLSLLRLSLLRLSLLRLSLLRLSLLRLSLLRLSLLRLLSLPPLYLILWLRSLAIHRLWVPMVL
jgi:hypothetical protein